METDTNKIYGTQTNQVPATRRPRQRAASSLIGASASARPKSTPTPEQIAQRAHEIWLSRGCEHGHDFEHWVQAERQLKRQ